MCGRTTRNYTWAEIHAYYSLINQAAPSNLQPRFNICPTTKIDTIVAADRGRELVQMRWGLVPGWWSKPLKEMRLATFNARAETVATKPMFRGAFKRNRCIIPVSGYYEWQHIDGQKKPQPWYFTRKDGEIISTAGVWDTWTDKESGKEIASCSMIITEPNALVAKVHDRMPVILQRDQFDDWLSATSGTDVLRPAPDDLLQMVQVSQRVNSSRHPDDDATLIEPLASAAQ